MSGITLDELVGLQRRSILTSVLRTAKGAVHTALISLVTRHAQTLAHHSPNADAVDMIVGEMGVSVRMLQGLCLLSAGCKAAVGEAWVIEVCLRLSSLRMTDLILVSPADLHRPTATTSRTLSSNSGRLKTDRLRHT